MSPALGTLDPTYLAILLMGLVGVAVFVLETIVIEYHPDALVFVVAFGLLLAGVAALAVDPTRSSATGRYVYHGVAIAGSGLAMVIMAYGRRRVFLRTGAEGEQASVLGDVEGGGE